MNPDSNLACSCGYDLSAIARRRLVAAQSDPNQMESIRAWRRGMTKWNFSIGVMIVWLVLSIGEGFRLKLELSSRATPRLIGDSLLIGITDLGGALAAGSLAWITVWVLRSYEALRYRPCPKRTTLAVTIIAAVLLFVGRLTPPGVIFQHVVQGLAILGAMSVAYYAGSRRWLGKW
jgi:hypothetical protein